MPEQREDIDKANAATSLQDVQPLPPAGTSDGFSETVSAAYRAGYLLDLVMNGKTPAPADDDGATPAESDGEGQGSFPDSDASVGSAPDAVDGELPVDGAGHEEDGSASVAGIARESSPAGKDEVDEQEPVLDFSEFARSDVLVGLSGDGEPVAVSIIDGDVFLGDAAFPGIPDSGEPGQPEDLPADGEEHSGEPGLSGGGAGEAVPEDGKAEDDALPGLGGTDPDPIEDEGYRRQEYILAKASRAWERLRHEPVVIACLVILLLIVVFVRAFLIPSGSMRPTLVEGDRILTIASYFPNGQTFNRGDIVCFREKNSGNVYVKRVIGKGGDLIEITGEQVYVNGELSEYQGTGGILTATRVQLGPEQYWVMGDNRGNSEDSRFIGPVSSDQMISKVWILYWPLDHFAWLG